MKKISYLLISLILLTNIGACSGYKPIFGSSNLEFEIADYSISGNKKIGNKIYTKLYNLSQITKKTSKEKNVYIFIHVLQSKNATANDSTGKILGYRINLSTQIIVRDLMANDEILNETLSFSSTYKVQNQLFETKKLENQIVQNLIDKTYEELLIKLSESFL